MSRPSRQCWSTTIVGVPDDREQCRLPATPRDVVTRGGGGLSLKIMKTPQISLLDSCMSVCLIVMLLAPRPREVLLLKAWTGKIIFTELCQGQLVSGDSLSVER